jgi:Co/Zn/Cd efflux system component
MGLYVLVTTLWQFITYGLPAAEIMGMIGFLAFAANLFSVLLLKRYKDGDANIRSVWLCSRNDMIGNIAVIGASAAVWITASGWPDLIVALYMGSLFLWSSVQILQQAWRERNGGGGSEHESHGAHAGHSH